jgi:hypothetical protein
MEKKEKTLVERIKAPTAKFFKAIRTGGLILAAAGGAIVVSPVALPAAVVGIAGYLIVAGGVMTAVAQVTVEND